MAPSGLGRLDSFINAFRAGKTRLIRRRGELAAKFYRCTISNGIAGNTPRETRLFCFAALAPRGCVTFSMKASTIRLSTNPAFAASPLAFSRNVRPPGTTSTSSRLTPSGASLSSYWTSFSFEWDGVLIRTWTAPPAGIPRMPAPSRSTGGERNLVLVTATMSSCDGARCR